MKPEWRSAPINVGVHGASKSSPIGDGERVYVGGDDGWFRCFSTDGRPLWRAYFADADRGVHSTAAIDSDSVYATSYRGTVYRLDKRTGRVLWARTLGLAIGASPLLVDGSLVVNVELFPPDGFLARLRRSDGALEWRSPPLGDQSHSSPSLDERTGLILVGVNNGTAQAFRADDGRRVWTVDLGGASKSTFWIEGGAFWTTDWGREISARAVEDGRPLWRADLGSRSQSSPAVAQADGRAVVATPSHNGVLKAYDARTGAPLWSLEPSLSPWEGRALASPVVVEDGRLERFLAPCGERRLCLIDAGNGAVVRAWRLPARFTGSPLVMGHALYLAYDEGGLQKFKIVY